MEYKFQILTTEGIKESIVESDSDFSCAPFGYVPYRFISTCDCSQEILDDFWRCIDVVLQNNNLTSENYIRSICAENSFGIKVGEFHENIKPMNSFNQDIIQSGPTSGPTGEWINKWL